jgi:Ni,Fe-hydrogenase III small subunit
MKTHDQLEVTLGVKNLKGILPKYLKRDFHKIGVVKGILDLNKAVTANLTVLDAIVAMEGLGPSFGPKVELNTVIASTNVYALDIVASKIMGFEPKELDYLVEAQNAGLINLNLPMEVVGEPISSYRYIFERPPTGTEFAKGVTVITSGACSACHGTIHSVFYDLEQMQKMGEIRDLVIIVGNKAEKPENLHNKPVFMGVCQEQNSDLGCYVQGCPPNNDKLLAAIREVCMIE